MKHIEELSEKKHIVASYSNTTILYGSAWE